MKIIFTLWLLLLVSVVFAQNPAKQNIPQPQRVATQVIQNKTEISTTQKERDLYKLLYENTAAANEKYITITQWTVGIAVTLLFGIIGAQIFFNYTLNKKELDNISAGIREQFNISEANLAQNIRTELGTALTTISMDKEAMRKELIESIDKQFAASEKELALELRMQKGELNLEIRQLRILIKKAEGDLWILKDVKANALSSFISAAEMEISMVLGNEKYTLEAIAKLLGELTEISHSDYESLQKLLPKVKPASIQSKTKIEGLIKTMPTYRFKTRSLDSIPGLFKLPMMEYVRNRPGESGDAPGVMKFTRKNPM